MICYALVLYVLLVLISVVAAAPNCAVASFGAHARVYTTVVIVRSTSRCVPTCMWIALVH